MRPRDVRAIAFCTVTIAGLFALLMAATHSYLPSLGVALAYAAFILTRPRMIRVFKRLRGDPDWSGYFDNGKVSRHGPAGSAGHPRPVERR